MSGSTSRRRSTPWRPAVVMLAVVLLVNVMQTLEAPGSVAAPEPAASVRGDDDADTFIGTGGLLLPDAVAPGVRRSVADCADCAWRVTGPCVENELGRAFGSDSACLSVTRGCPGGDLRRTWFQPSGGTWQDLGLHCVRERPVTVADIRGGTRDRLEEALRPPVLRHSPGQGVATGLPTVFLVSDASAEKSFDWVIGGRPVQVTVRPTITWAVREAGARSARTPADDGEGAVTHVFRRSGRAWVTCSISWVGTFTVAGLGPYPVQEPVEQEVRAAVEVGEGRALLVP